MMKISLYERLKLCAVFQAAAHIFITIFGVIFFTDFSNASLIPEVFRFFVLIISFLFAPFLYEKLKFQQFNNNSFSFFQKFKATMLFTLPLFFLIFSSENFDGAYSDLLFLFSFGLIFYIFFSAKNTKFCSDKGIDIFNK